MKYHARDKDEQDENKPQDSKKRKRKRGSKIHEKSSRKSARSRKQTHSDQYDYTLDLFQAWEYFISNVHPPSPKMKIRKQSVG